MKSYNPIDCDLHDYLEIACLYHYRLQIELTDGSFFDGIALTTLTTMGREEYLIIETGEMKREIRLDFLSTIRTLDAGDNFDTIRFY